MYSEKLERMISYALEDGVMEDGDRQLINKVAVAENVDLDELDMYIRKLIKKQRKAKSDELEEKEIHYSEEKKKKEIASAKDLLRQIEEINKEYTSNQATIKSREDVLSSFTGNKTDEREKRVNDLISMFPVPNKPEDIIEFLSLAAAYVVDKPKQKFSDTIFGKIVLCIVTLGIYLYYLLFKMISSFGSGAQKSDYERQMERYNAWHIKYKQVLMKGRSLQGNDDELKKQLNYYENLLKK